MSIYRIVFILITEIIRLLITSRFVLSFFNRNNYSFMRMVAYSSSLVITTIAYSFINIAWVNLLATLIGLIMISCTYHGNIRKKILFVLYVLAISCIIDLSVYVFLSNSFKHSDYSDLASILGLLFLLGAQLFTKRALNNNKSSEIRGRHWWQYVFSLIVCIASCLIIITDKTISVLSLSIVCGSFLIVNLIVVYLMDDLIKKSQGEIENQVLKDQMKAYEREILLQNEKVESVRAIRHDMKKHLAEIKALYKKNLFSSIDDYIDKLEDELNESAPISDSGNPGLDTILNYMLAKAIDKGIAVNSKVVVPREYKLSVYDMNIILGNLIENAIEANENFDDPQIDLTIKYVKESLCIEISNTYSNEIKIKDGYPSSTKNANNKHGYGLKNVVRILERYSYSIDFDISQDRFTVLILMKEL